MYHCPADIYTESEPDSDTLSNLGPLTGMAGIWTGTDGMDVNPKPDGPEHQPFIERYELEPSANAIASGVVIARPRCHAASKAPDGPRPRFRRNKAA